MSLKSNGQVVGDVEVVNGQVIDSDASGTDQIQGVAFVMGWVIERISRSSVAGLQSEEST